MLTKNINTKLNIVCINVPGSLLEKDLLRKDELLKLWSSIMISNDGAPYPIHFLENVCIPSEIVNDPYLTELAKRHDTFISPSLKKAIITQYFPFDPESKDKAINLVSKTIIENWDILVEILKFLNFKNSSNDIISNAVLKLGLECVVYPNKGQIFNLSYPIEQHDYILINLLEEF